MPEYVPYYVPNGVYTIRSNTLTNIAAPTMAELADAMNGFTRAVASQTDAFLSINADNTVEPLAPWERELLSAAEIEALSVGNPNQATQGGNMPAVGTQELVEVRIDQNPEQREEVFQNLGLNQRIMGSVDPEVWAQAARDLATATGPVVHQVARGSYDVGTPRTRVGSLHINVNYLSLANANDLVQAASNGRVSIALEYATVHRLKLITEVEDTLWTEHSGDSLYAEDMGGVLHINTRELRVAMESYSRFRSQYRNERVRNRLRRNMQAHEPVIDLDQQNRRVDAFSRHLAEKKVDLVVVPEPFKLMTILPHKTLASRRWGIEIEAVDIEGVETPKGWVLHGDGSLRSLSSGFTRPGGASDGGETLSDHLDGCSSSSLDADCDCGECYNECDCGYDDQQWAQAAGTSSQSKVGEWNSPILRSIHSRGLKYITDLIEHRNKNTSPGIHVHVEASDLTPTQTAQLSVIYATLEPLWEAEYQREERRYCESPTVPELVKRFREANRVKGMGKEAVRAMSFSSRYWTVNLAALAKQGTIEFRAMGPDYNYEKLVRWGAFCREMVNIAKANVPQSVWGKCKTFQDVITMFSRYGKETPTPEWAKNRPEVEAWTKLGTEDRRTPNIIKPPRGSREPVDLFDDYTGTAFHTTTRVLVNG